MRIRVALEVNGACKNIESSFENDRKVPCEVKSSTAFVKSPTVINKSTSAIDKSAAMIYLFQNIIVSLLPNTWVNDVHLGRKRDWLLCALYSSQSIDHL